MLPIRRSAVHCAVLMLAAVVAPLSLAPTTLLSQTIDTTAQQIGGVVVKAALTPTVTGGSSEVAINPVLLNVTAAPLLHEVLRHTPFVLVRQNSRGEMEVSVRGSDSRQVAIVLDGLPLSIGWDSRTDPSLIPVTGVQSVRFVRGLSSLLSGPNVLGGVIELGLGSNAYGSPKEKELFFATGGDADGAISGNLVGGRTVAVGNGTLSLRGGGGYRKRDGFSLSHDVDDQYSSDALRTNTALDEYDAFASLRLQGQSGRYIGITGTGFSAERGVAPELHITNPRFWKYPNQSRTLGVVSMGSGLLSTPFGHGAVDLSTGYTRGTSHIESYASGDYSTISSEELGDERLTTGRVQLTHTFFNNGTLKAAFTGGKVQYEEILGTVHSDYEQRLWSSGLEVDIPVGGRLNLSGGVVNDASTTPLSGGRTPLPRRDAWGWRAGASLLTGTAGGRIHASISTRGRFPALRELYSGSLNRFEPNPDLLPESLTGYELGWSMTTGSIAASTLNFQVVGFHHDLDDAVVRTTLPNNRFFRVNRDRIRTTGVEVLGGLVPASNGVSVTADLLIQNIKVEDKTIPDGSRQVEHQPEFKAGLEMGFPLVLGTRGLASLRHSGRMYCLHPNSDELVELSSQSVGDLGASRTFRMRSGATGLLGSLKVLFSVDNVTDAAVYDQCGLPQPGRTVRFGFQIF